LGDQVIAVTLSFANFIYTDNYFLTTFDLWLLVNRFKIPTIFICHKFILQTKYQNHEFVGYGDFNDEFAFVILPGFRAENIPNFKIIQSDKGDVFISLNVIIEECLINIQNAIRNKISIQEYLDEFFMPPKTTYKKKNPLLIEEIDIEKPKDIKKPKKIEEQNKIEEEKKIEKPEPDSPEEFIMQPTNKKSRKVYINKGETKNKSRKKRD
jgi:hypothetical protein